MPNNVQPSSALRPCVRGVSTDRSRIAVQLQDIVKALQDLHRIHAAAARVIR